MKSSKASVGQIGSEKKSTIVIGFMVLFVIVAGAYLWSRGVGRNYAAEVAAPVESSLKEAGAVKACDRGDSGKGMSNTTPWYEVYYYVQRNERDATALIEESASRAGYSLERASIQNRGPVRVADQFVDKWFYDTVNKVSPYKDLASGSIELLATVNAEGSDGTCGPKKARIDETNSVISVRVRLPSYK